MRLAMMLSLFVLPSCVAPTSGGLPPPDISGSYSGSYTYGSGYSGSRAGSSVPFTVEIYQTPGSNRFSGVMRESYSDFGVPLAGKLWADIKGTCSRAPNGSTVIQFKKTYRFFKQDSLNYQGGIAAGGDTLAGTWLFPGQPNLSGTFALYSFPSQ